MSRAIKVEQLGKKYKVPHGRRAGYSTLRDLIGDSARALTKWGREAAQAKPVREEFWALSGLDFEVGMGERVAVIGHNGAGKSTLLKLLSRITAPSHGRITLHGRIASLLEVGTGFHPDLTGRENVFVNGSIWGMTRREIREKFDEIVAFSEVERFIDTPVKRYSSGMYMRLAFAVAAHLEPEILLVDEVLAVGDAQFQAKCLAKMEAIARQGRTILFVSHNMSAVSKLCERAIWLQQGRLQESGPVDALIAKYLEAAPSSAPISGRTDRIGTGMARAIDMYLRDASGARVGTIGSEAAVSVVLQIETAQESIGKPITIVAIVCDRSGTRLFALNSEWQRVEYIVASRVQTFVCDLPDGLPLQADHYTVLTSILVSGVNADKLSNAMQFEVTPGAAGGSGVGNGSLLGPMRVSQAWQVSR
jgi:lipopolysaccharide transport system ATP-binding protein